ncbi:transketolase, N-terminal subunit [Spirochaetia bacterium]|nr:transketolase, N-terminal subunit [Spirochaetia bacterium]
MNNTLLITKANEIRKKSVAMITKARGGHMGSSLSEADILAVLFFNTLNFRPQNLKDPERDRFVLSKGHASEGYYSVLAEAGFFPSAWLDDYLSHDCPLTIHPTNHVPGIEVCTGALGHGFPIALGMALGAVKTGKKYRVFVLTGDGELEEGTNWEAAMAASYYKLGNLVLIVDVNGLQLADTVANTMEIQPLKEKFESFGMDVHEVDGHDTEAMASLFDSLDYSGNKPHVVLARTVKGKGVSFMENHPEWHHTIPSEEQCRAALEELKI